MGRILHIWRATADRRGASTVEYVIVVLAAAMLAAVVYGVLSGDETKGKIQSAIQRALNLEPQAYDGEVSGKPSDRTESQSEKGPSEKNPSEQKPSKWDLALDFMKRKGNYIQEQGGAAWDHYSNTFKEEWDYATSDPVGWWFWDDLRSGVAGKDNRSGEELGFFESVDRTVSGIPIGIGKGWKYGKGIGSELFRVGKKTDDFFVGLACAKEKKGKCSSDSNNVEIDDKNKRLPDTLSGLSQKSQDDAIRVIKNLQERKKLPDDYSRSGKSGMAGGNKWANKNNDLPPGNYKEADVGHKAPDGTRGPERIVYSDDGRYYYTPDHYNTFIQINPRDLK